ncbi:hypothetical protein T440DRAFT_191838 [Plenodomus tracheiphilus IPT5]|uniref:Uncharacterized protein n=1 Tax=Plenodomus tracheiphilus IPT5 TaxID=1408161 RepID=A0A6A7AZ78_9PLEO|nr:hypothetical protein T440DRAFT_191838 [Plenodomus tracheiphilus IPT5]
MPGAVCAMCGVAINPRALIRDVIDQVRKKHGNTPTSPVMWEKRFPGKLRSAQDEGTKASSPNKGTSGMPRHRSSSPKRNGGQKPQARAKSNPGDDFQGPLVSDDDDDDDEPRPGPASSATSSEKLRDPSGLPRFRPGPRPTPDKLPVHLIPPCDSSRIFNRRFQGGRARRTSTQPSFPVSEFLNTPFQPQQDTGVPGQSNVSPTTDNAADIVARGFFRGLGQHTTSTPSSTGLSLNEQLFGRSTSHAQSPPIIPQKRYSDSETTPKNRARFATFIAENNTSSTLPEPPSVTPSTSQGHLPVSSASDTGVPPRIHKPKPKKNEGLRIHLGKHTIESEIAEAVWNRSMITVERGSSADRKARDRQSRKETRDQAAAIVKAKAE